jgi:hypothetical protein
MHHATCKYWARQRENHKLKLTQNKCAYPIHTASAQELSAHSVHNICTNMLSPSMINFFSENIIQKNICFYFTFGIYPQK